MVAGRLGIGRPNEWYGHSPQIYFEPSNVSETPVADSIFSEVLAAPNLRTFYAAHREDYTPATDDRPFFNQIIGGERCGLKISGSLGLQLTAASSASPSLR